MNRRHFLAMTTPAVVGATAAPGVLALASEGSAAMPDTSSLEAALAGFRDLSGQTSYAIKVDRPDHPWSASHQPDARLFVGSAVKTFILAKYLQDIEEGRLSADQQLAIDDSVRSLSSPVFLHLTGTTPARSVLEAMITHSDNTATDVALKQVEVERVRAFVAEAGLATVQIPTSTRHLFSYLAGAPFGVDESWQGMRRLAEGDMFGVARSPMNDMETMKGSAAEFVAYYERALAGEYFRKPETLVEFKRIQAMADAIARVVPADTPAWGKGGSIEWDNFNCLCFPGQMRRGTMRATFCFTLNWPGPADEVPQATARYAEAVANALAGVAAAFA
jgi:beta-lactamase class A